MTNHTPCKDLFKPQNSVQYLENPRISLLHICVHHVSPNFLHCNFHHVIFTGLFVLRIQIKIALLYSKHLMIFCFEVNV